jgi:sugar lactone lactonase YvrE
MVWPKAPETARFEHVRSFYSNDQLNPGFWRRFLAALLPHGNPTLTKSPLGLAFSPDERYLYVACGVKGGVVAFDRQKEVMAQLITDADHLPKLAHGVATDAKGDLYVSDRDGGAILVFDAGGRHQRDITWAGMMDPAAMAIDRKGQVLYVLAGGTSNNPAHRIEVFSLKGEHLRTLGKTGEGPGEFYFPSALLVGADGNLFVVDMLNTRVQLLDPEGRQLASFGQAGTGLPGYFDKPKGIAADAFGNLYVADSMQGVHVFNPRYQALMAFGQPLIGTPGAIAIDSKNRIYVADFKLNLVHEFQLVNTTAEDSYGPSAAPAGPSPTPPAETPPATPAR